MAQSSEKSLQQQGYWESVAETLQNPLGYDTSKYQFIDASGMTVSNILKEYGCDFESLLRCNSEENVKTLMYSYPRYVYMYGTYHADKDDINKYGIDANKGKNTLKAFAYPYEFDKDVPDWLKNITSTDYVYMDTTFESGLWEVTSVTIVTNIHGDTYKRIDGHYVEPTGSLVTDYLKFCNSQGLKIGAIRYKNDSKETFENDTNQYICPFNINLLVPIKQSGGLTNDTGILVDDEEELLDITTADERILAAQRVFTWTSSGIGYRSPVSTVQYHYVSTSYFILFGRNEDALAGMYLPVFPQEFSDNNQSQFAATNILGRSVQYQTYNSSSRTFNFSLNLHEELCDDYTYIHTLAGVLQSACYPNYIEGRVDPIEIMLVIGSQIQIRGILNSVGESWSGPVIDDQLVHCVINLSITETTGPYSQNNIMHIGSKRGTVLKHGPKVNLEENVINVPSGIMIAPTNINHGGHTGSFETHGGYTGSFATHGGYTGSF
jgi:hypothetical protein